MFGRVTAKRKDGYLCPVSFYRYFQATHLPMIIEHACFPITSPMRCIIDMCYLSQSRGNRHLIVV